MADKYRSVSVIVPCRNERRYIATFCTGVLCQQLPNGWALEVILADGLSDDGTRDVLQGIVADDARLSVIDNPGRIVSTGLNLALARAVGEIVVRMDVHTEYSVDYISECIAALHESGADTAGGPWHAVAGEDGGAFQQAVAAAFQSRWVTGGALSRRLDFSGWVDTVYLGSWPRATFVRFGGFDESLVRNQDDEHNLRIRLGSGRVWQSARIRSVYRPRTSLQKVFRQYMQYGYWKPFVISKHGQAASLRHFVPAVFVAAVVLLTGAAVLGAPPWIPWALIALYGLCVSAMSFLVLLEGRLGGPGLAYVPIVITTYHVSYGIGSLCGWWDVVTKRRGGARFSSPTT